MSVINTMLKDLERRGADGTAGDKILDGICAGGDNHTDNVSSSKPWLISLSIVIVIMAFVIGGYYLSPYRLVDAIAGSKIEPASGQIDQLVVAKKVKHRQLKKVEASTPTPASHGQAVAATGQTALHETPATMKARPVPRVKKPSPSSSSHFHPHPSSTIVTAPATKVVAVVKRVTTETSAQKQPFVAAKAVAVAHREPASVEDDSAMNEATSLQVMTKQRRALTPAEKSRQAYVTAMSLYDKGRQQEAKSSLIQSLAFNPGNADACQLLAVIYLGNGRADLAAATVESGLKMHGRNQNLLRLYVQSLVKLKKYSQAVAVMGGDIQLTSPEDFGYLAGLYQKNNDHLDAIKFYTEALQLVPGKSIWWLGQGISLEILQQYKTAIQSYQKSVSTGELSTRLMEYAVSRINVIKKSHPDSTS